VLGKFCEKLLRTKSYEFSKADFLTFALDYCREMAIDVDCAKLFEVIETENIIIRRNDLFHFRYVQWVYFFAAHRMHHDEEFRQYILSDARYVSFPEIIEFYSGIDRRRHELLTVLIRDLSMLNESFESRTKIDRDLDPCSFAKWSPSEQEVAKLRTHIDEGVKQSSLPVEIKDSLADKSYNRAAPYTQEIRTFIRDSSLAECLQLMRAAARALRNSDYVDKTLKTELLDEILRAWSKVLQILVLLSPVLVRDRSVVFESIRFFLGEDFKAEGRQLWLDLFRSIPYNAVSCFEKDLTSSRLTAIFNNLLSGSSNTIGKHIIAATLIRQRPKGWQSIVKKYMLTLDKNSFYLLCLYGEITREWKYGFCSSQQRKELEELWGVAVAKHELGTKNPSSTVLKKVMQQITKT